MFVLFFRQITLRNNYCDNGASIAFKTRDGKAATYALDGTTGQEYIDDIQIMPEEVVIPKLRSNGFCGTYVEKVLRANNITTLVFTGTQTEGCVLSTMMGAEQNGFHVVPVFDAIETSVADIQGLALQFIDYRFSLKSTDYILKAWETAGR